MFVVLAVGTRPDISFAVNFLARFSAKPSVNHWKGLRHLINYIAGSTDLALCLYPKCDILNPLQIYCDASWGGEFSRSTYGVLINFMGCPVLWVSRRQATVAASTCHAEYMALGSATRHTLWVRHLLKDILGQDFVGLLLCDNQAAVKVSSDDASNKRTRHTDRDFFITNEALFKRLVQLKWIPTAEQLADIFTKSLGPELFRRIRPKLVH
jgi:hypothetical protein